MAVSTSPNMARGDLEHAVQCFHALSDETRLEIVEFLRGGEQCVCDLTDALDAAQSRLSFHLKTLKDAGLVTDRKQGRWVYYSLNAETLAALSRFVDALKPSTGSASGVSTLGRALRGLNRCCR